MTDVEEGRCKKRQRMVDEDESRGREMKREAGEYLRLKPYTVRAINVQ